MQNDQPLLSFFISTIPHCHTKIALFWNVVLEEYKALGNDHIGDNCDFFRYNSLGTVKSGKCGTIYYIVLAFLFVMIKHKDICKVTHWKELKSQASAWEYKLKLRLHFVHPWDAPCLQITAWLKCRKLSWEWYNLNPAFIASWSDLSWFMEFPQIL